MLDSNPNFNGQIMRSPIQLLALICVVLALSACGKKGDLYLPDAPNQPLQTHPDE